jgi:hypothetical protein
MSKYKYVEENGKVGYRESDCGCGGKKPSSEIREVDMEKILLYIGPVRTRINGYMVLPNALLIGLTDSAYEALVANNRFKVPTDEQKKTLDAVFGK